ncbi:MAG: type IV secretory system conjugative DNA transfer family protein [Acidobacteria bacterium]|nr:type IV secretory system conjugative DNA transfer family protein [Acidobacteriota bacterium]
MSLDQFFKRWDARYGIPRPANALHLDSYQAGLRLLSDAGKGMAMLAAGGASSLIWWKIGGLFQQVGVEMRLYMIFVVIFCAFISLLEASSLAIPYYRITQRVTYGSARWAEASELKDLGLAFDNRQELPHGALRIGRLTRRYDLALPFKQVLCHTAIFGPPGSGKSSNFFMSMARDWSRHGSAIFLDPKGELYRHTARHFKRVYRLDLADPRLSDRWNFVPACRGDAELAHEIASIVVGYDANKNVSYDPFWPQAETALLTSLLLHLPRVAENPTPAHIAEFIATRGFDQINHEMLDSPDPEARVQWGIFKKADREKTQGGVYIGLGTKLAPLRSPHAMAVMRSVSPEERERGLREIDLYDLRKPSTGVYVVVPEGDATRYKIVLSILFGLAASVARKTSDDEGGAPVLLALDEAGNIPIHNLSEALGVGRGRRCGIVLGYQNIGQLYKQYGRDGAQAILGSIGGMVFLPGLDAETSQYAAKRVGRTTALQHRSVDATGPTYDHEGLVETGRDLIDAAELRQMPEHTQAVAIFGSVPPIKFGFPPFAKVGHQFHALPRELAPPVTLAQAEAALATRRVEESTEQAGPNNSSRDEIEFDLDGYLGNTDGSVDSVIQSLLDSLPSPVARVETKAERTPETRATRLRIDPDSVLETGALDILEEDVETPVASRSAQLTFGWRLDDSDVAAPAAVSNGGKGARA